MISSSCTLFLIFTLICFLPRTSTAPTQPINVRPVIGVLTQPTPAGGQSFLAASYVKWLEAAGAKVVPVPWDANEDTLKEIFYTINGLLLPGGGIYLPGSKYENAATYLYNLTLLANDGGDFFPLWGTCQGFEQLVMMTSGNTSVLENFDSYNYSTPLKFTDQAISSEVFHDLPDKLWETFENKLVCENLHRLGISPLGFLENGLDKFYKLLSINFGPQ